LGIFNLILRLQNISHWIYPLNEHTRQSTDLKKIKHRAMAPMDLALALHWCEVFAG
jgi:hypothetical protein